MDVWEWEQLSQDISCTRPDPRTDHTAVLWEKNNSNECMIVFGGNIDGSGPCSELWALECPIKSRKQKNQVVCAEESNLWHPIEVSGPNPPARTSHTAAIIGKGDMAKMIIVGGNGQGAGRKAMLCDAWVLNLVGENNTLPTWIKLDWRGDALDRCRHSMAVVDSTQLIIWGGYNGESTIDEGVGVWQGDLGSSNINIDSSNYQDDMAENRDLLPLQERWEAEIPVRVEDLPPDVLAKAKSSRLPGAEYKALHRHAVANNRTTYIDPASGYSVFSQVYLKRRPCCGNGCRHCPHGYINVPKKGNECKNKDPNLEW